MDLSLIFFSCNHSLVDLYLEIYQHLKPQQGRGHSPEFSWTLSRTALTYPNYTAVSIGQEALLTYAQLRENAAGLVTAFKI